MDDVIPGDDGIASLFHSKKCLSIQMVVNPEMLRSRSITFLVFMMSYQLYFPSQDFFRHF